MNNFASYSRPAFLGDHPPVLARMVMESDGSEATYLAGSVLGRDASGKLGLWTPQSADMTGILAGDVTVPASGGASVDVYVHAHVVADALLFADGVSAEDEKAALVALRLKGIYSAVTWAAPKETSPEKSETGGEQTSSEKSENGGGE